MCSWRSRKRTSAANPTVRAACGGQSRYVTLSRRMQARDDADRQNAPRVSARGVHHSRARLCAAIVAGLALRVVRFFEWDRKIHVRAVAVAGSGAERIVDARREHGLGAATVLSNETPQIAQPVGRQIEVERALSEQQSLSAEVKGAMERTTAMRGLRRDQVVREVWSAGVLLVTKWIVNRRADPGSGRVRERAKATSDRCNGGNGSPPASRRGARRGSPRRNANTLRTRLK